MIDWTVSFGNLLTIGGVVAGAVAGYFAMRYEVRLTRHDVKNQDQKIAQLSEKISDIDDRVEGKIDAIDGRLRRVEMDNVAGVLLRTDFKEFQAEIGRKLEQNRKEVEDSRKERREDIRGLHSRLNDLVMVPPKGGAE